VKIIRFVDDHGQTLHGIPAGGGHAYPLIGDLISGFTVGQQAVTVGRLLAPVAPSSIIGIGLNYREHARETNAKIPEWPVVFFKNVNALSGPNDAIVLPRKLHSDKVDFECELAVVIGKTCKNVSRENALDYVLGYTCGNDVSARLAEGVGRRPMVAGEVVRYVLPAGARARHDRRDHEP
jgi:2-keto-4-pentenoate hydratase/2-oxohepta-3-ene-1,7-dioic acid hydratase in catechol pathway